MKTNSMLIIVSNKNLRQELAVSFIKKGFNVVAINPTESPDFYMVRETHPTYAIIDHPDDLPGGTHLLKVLSEIDCAVAYSEDPKFLPKEETVEYRRHDRRDMQLDAKCEISPNLPTISCKIVNMSKSGARISAGGFKPKIGEVVEIQAENGMLVSGVVRWVKEDFGIEIGMKSQEMF
jgi:PilZ domain